MEAATFCLDCRDKTPEIFERMKRTLARIAQYVLLLAMGEGNADQPMDGRADEANDGVLIGEDANHLGPPLDLAVEALDGVGGVQLGSMLRRERPVGVRIGHALMQKNHPAWPAWGGEG